MHKIQNGRHEVEIKARTVGIANEGLLEGKEYDMILHASMLECQEEEQNMIMRLVLPRYEKGSFSVESGPFYAKGR